MQRRKNAGKGGFFHTFWGSCVGGMVVALLCGMGLLVILALIGTGAESPSQVILPFGLLALALTMLVAGWMSVSLWGHDTPVPALVSGSILALVLVAVGLCFGGSTLPLGVRLSGAPIGILLALIGGLVAGRKPKRHRRRA